MGDKFYLLSEPTSSSPRSIDYSYQQTIPMGEQYEDVPPPLYESINPRPDGSHVSGSSSAAAAATSTGYNISTPSSGRSSASSRAGSATGAAGTSSNGAAYPRQESPSADPQRQPHGDNRDASSGYMQEDPMKFTKSDDDYKPGRYWSERGGCCFSDRDGCCFSDNGGCCFSDNGGCCFSDNGGCLFSDNGGCLFSDNGGCCFSDPKKV
ncbi:hypothetical protein BX600DRAFT_443332 [Xylariales sp. PMI_506]|nr:hypothetical protein BX600DRAFT_443332 [Xylariales sp. PMI_506]